MISRLSFPPVVIHQSKTQFTFKYRFNENQVVVILKCTEILSHYVVDLELIVLQVNSTSTRKEKKKINTTFYVSFLSPIIYTLKETHTVNNLENQVEFFNTGGPFLYYLAKLQITGTVIILIHNLIHHCILHSCMEVFGKSLSNTIKG